MQTLPADPAFGVVGVNNGKINGFDTCFTAQIAWAGANRSVYIIMEPAPGNNPVQETSGPEASCAKTSNSCLGYDWGYNYAMADIAFVKAAGLSPKVWWVDVEIGEQWPTAAVDQPVNAAIIQGALDAIKGAGHIGGVYSTWFQWGEITGSYIPPGLAAPVGSRSEHLDRRRLQRAVVLRARAFRGGPFDARFRVHRLRWRCAMARTVRV